MERKRVTNFVKSYKKSHPDHYVFVDRDSPGRMHRSGWDFLISHGEKVIFVEAKESNLKKFTPYPPGLLSPLQNQTMGRIVKSEGIYVILIFYPLIKKDCVHACIYHHFDIYDIVSGEAKIISTIQELLK